MQPRSVDEAFLDSIIAEPADDAPRLIYADYLEDQGRAERAEFIRVQCELAKLPPARPVLKPERTEWIRPRPEPHWRRFSPLVDHEEPELEAIFGSAPAGLKQGDICDIDCERGAIHDALVLTMTFQEGHPAYLAVRFRDSYSRDPHRQKRTPLLKRERELLIAHWTVWSQGLKAGYLLNSYDGKPFVPPNRAIRFVRGFVGEILCGETDWLNSGATLTAAQPIEYARLADKRPFESPADDDGTPRSYPYSWMQYREMRGLVMVDASEIISPPIWSHLEATANWSDDIGHARCYSTEEEAYDALSLACLKYAKEAAS